MKEMPKCAVVAAVAGAVNALLVSILLYMLFNPDLVAMLVQIQRGTTPIFVAATPTPVSTVVVTPTPIPIPTPTPE